MMATLRPGYRQLVDRWICIVGLPIGEEERRAACCKALRDFVDALADQCRSRSNPVLAFHATMFALRDDLRGIGVDDLRMLAILPAFTIVSDWLARHEVTGYVAPDATWIYPGNDIPVGLRLP